MRVFLVVLAALALSACVREDGSPALGASDAQQVFTFVMTGDGSRGGHCTVEGARGEVSSGKDLLGAPSVKIRGNIRYGTIICTDNRGAKYMTIVNRQVPQGLRFPEAWGYLRDGKVTHNVELQLSNGVKRVFYNALIRVK